MFIGCRRINILILADLLRQTNYGRWPITLTQMGAEAMKPPKVICDHAGKGSEGCRYYTGEPCEHSVPHKPFDDGDVFAYCTEPDLCFEIGSEDVVCIEVKPERKVGYSDNQL